MSYFHVGCPGQRSRMIVSSQRGAELSATSDEVVVETDDSRPGTISEDGTFVTPIEEEA